MIPLCFPQPLLLNGQDTPQMQLLAYKPEVGTILDSSRVYLFLEETYKSMLDSCQDAGLAPPIPLAPGIIQEIPAAPLDLKKYWQQPISSPDNLQVCLINGGGGGLGDGVMFAPALNILTAHLKKQSGIAKVQIDVFSSLPKRTNAILGDIPGVRVLPLPLTLQEFTNYDLYTDFSGMMLDKLFAHAHMTDFALQKMGIDPANVDDSLKNPRIQKIPALQTVKISLAQARQAAYTRPLTAVIFTATKTRSMPDDLAAKIMKEMLPVAQPVIIMPPGSASKTIIERNNLQEVAIDMSPVSTNFSSYIAILAGMDAIISVDTSAVHLGAALGKPTIGIFSSIDHRLRVKYSSTVQPIQITYSGRKCQAPCGLSKNRFYYQTTLANGRQISWSFGYSCAEAFEQNKMIEWLDRSLQQINLEDDTNRQLHNIRKLASEYFTLEAAPCWQALDVDEIINTLKLIIDNNYTQSPGHNEA